MGKKGKGNKLAKMSEEERARYLQMRADMEEETRRRKMQLISLYMKNKLKREDAFCRLNIAKINQEWRSVLRQVKIQDLRREIIEVEQFSKEALKRKDQVIQRLIGDISTNEDMYANLQQSHMEKISKIIDTYKSRIEFFTQSYEEDKQAVLKEWEQDFAVFKAMHADRQEELECVFYQVEETTERAIKDNHERFLERVEDLKSGMQLLLEKITSKGEAKLEGLWQEYQSVLAGYVKHIEGFYAEYVDLKERDEENAAQISSQTCEIDNLLGQLANLKLVTEEFAGKQEREIEQRQSIKQQLSDRLKELRDCVEKELGTERKRFKEMSVESYNAIETLKDIVSKGETILQLAGVCGKMETQREKMFLLPQLTREIIEIREVNDGAATPDPLKSEVELLPKMETFWRRVNNVAVDVACLKQQKKKLEATNARLKLELQEHLVNLNISNGSNSHVNDYISKRPKSMVVDRVQQLQLRPKQIKSAMAADRRGMGPRFHVRAWEAKTSKVVPIPDILKSQPQLTITTPLGEYLKTPLKNCVGLCPCRVPDEKPHCYAGMHCPWSYSNVNSGVLKQPKPRFDGYLHTLLHEHYASQKFSKSRPRSQDLYIHVNRNNRYAKGTED
ncbi:dynein regulatory complex subunit 2 [Scaptodrosophila lebanonensis]|uniref:Dynein regulatory complex subunit 2 n=1 Tax=Drosophila lebanonensis TaxID=7225 RepID=A0A6J2UJX1_DROLE|nr:dynein regulatory complex subunit 2 [Scaptodrosophila lebanonensis]